MSWWVYLGKKKPVTIDSHCDGGTYVMGGSDEAELNITYNYSKFYYQALDKRNGLRWLHNKRAHKCLYRLRKAILQLGTQQDMEYWNATSGNAGYALDILYQWARQYPMAKFRVS